jgi:hypothetical protein
MCSYVVQRKCRKRKGKYETTIKQDKRELIENLLLKYSEVLIPASHTVTENEVRMTYLILVHTELVRTLHFILVLNWSPGLW